MYRAWLLWKVAFLEAHEVLQKQIQACGGAYHFFSANAASVAANPSKLPTGITTDILDKRDDYMYNMDNTVSNKKDILDQPVATNTKQASNITTQATTILALSDEVKQPQLRIINKGGRGGRGGKSNDVIKCLKYGYFCSHG